VREREIDCDFERKAAYAYSEQQDNVEALQEEADAAARFGLPASFVRTAPMAAPVAGAVRFDNQAQFHPRKYLLHLLKDIPGGGCHVFENTRVTDIEEGSPCRVKTDKGEFTAREVILATNLPILDRGAFFAVNHPIAHACLAARIPSSAAPDGMFISIDEPSFSIRTQPDPQGIVAIVTGPRFKTGQGDAEEACAQSEHWVRRHFQAESITHVWANEDYQSDDSLPFIGRIDADAQHLWVATGLNAWGMTMGTMAAMVLADCIQGKANPWFSTFDSTRARPEPSAVDSALQNLNVAKEWLKGKLFPTPRKEPGELVPGQGMIVGSRDGDLAVYCDDAGDIHAFSATCTHQGCTVAWNPVGKTWDCPCHGSRFDRSGHVLYGPAVRNLEPRQFPQQARRKAS
jgi:glycine/D-amino acid oxidase-like deaminating enzyme/nitrite reductase/ring-hydroxylating ferredoxin subunit